MQTRIFRRDDRVVTAIFLGAALLFQGCADPGQTRTASTIFGGIAGGVAGGLLGDTEGVLIGAGAGALLGYIAGSIVYKQQMHLEAQKAAAKARVDEAQSVLKKYRDYNKNLEVYVKKVRAAAGKINAGGYTAEEQAAAKTETLAQIEKANAGAQESITALQTFRAKVESEQVSAEDEQKRQRLLQKIEELKVEEDHLMAQMQALGQVRGEIGGG